MCELKGKLAYCLLFIDMKDLILIANVMVYNENSFLLEIVSSFSNAFYFCHLDVAILKSENSSTSTLFDTFDCTMFTKFFSSLDERFVVIIIIFSRRDERWSSPHIPVTVQTVAVV